MRREDIWRGAQLMASNAAQLYKSAEAVAGGKCYGPAVSLLILSAEEAIKALAYAYAAISDSGIKEIEKDFRTHKIKHTYGSLIGMFTDVMPKILERAVSIDEDEDTPAFLKRIRFSEYAKKICGGHENEKLEAWCENANNMKNAGFYVDFVDGAWRAPRLMTERDFLENKEICAYFLHIAYRTLVGCNLNDLIEIRKHLFDR